MPRADCLRYDREACNAETQRRIEANPIAGFCVSAPLRLCVESSGLDGAELTYEARRVIVRSIKSVYEEG